MNRKTIFGIVIVASGILLIVNGVRMAFGLYTFPFWVQAGNAICLGMILVAAGMERLSPLRTYLKRKPR